MKRGQLLKSWMALVLMAVMLSGAACGDAKPQENSEGGTTNVLERLTAAPKVEKTEKTVTIKPEETSASNGGVFEGWGTSFCWWANRIGYSNSLSEQAARAFYDKEEGLGFNIVRFNIGGGDDPEHAHITRTDSAMPGYMVYDETTGETSYDWSADANQRNVLLRAQDYCDENEFIVEGFSNSPPYFMTVSGCTSGAENANDNNLREDCVDAFADYLAEVTLHYKNEWGVSFQSISPMNEPYTDYWSAFSEKQEGCHYDQGKTQSNMLIALSAALERKGLSDVLIAGTDETSIDTQITSYKLLSDEAKAVLDRIDTHTYGGSARKTLSELAASEGKGLWMSEVDGGDMEGTYAREMGAALWLAKRIIADVNGLRPSAWVLWQAIDNHVSDEGYNGHSDSGMVERSSGYWGLAVANHNTDSIILTQKYYAMGQFSRYIRPGYEIIGVSDTDNMLAAYDSESERLVIVAINTDEDDTPVCFDLSGFSKTGETVQPVRTSGSYGKDESWAELEKESVEGKEFHTTLKGNSVTTYLIDGVQR